MTSGRSKTGDLETTHRLPLNGGSTTLDEAVRDVLHWLVSGAAEDHIVEALQEKHPEQDPRRILERVAAKLAQEGRPSSDAVRGWALLAYRELYRRMIDIGDFSGALKAVKEITALVK